MSTTNFQSLSIFKSINIKSDLNESFRGQQNGKELELVKINFDLVELSNFLKFIDKLAGFIQSGKFSWIAYDAVLRIISTDNGVEIAYFNFAKHHG